MRRGCCCALALAISLPCSSALGAPSAKPSAADRMFLQTASQGDRFEVATGELATQITRDAQTPPAKTLATMAGKLVADHQRSQQRLTRLAQGLHVRVSTQPDPVQQFLVTQLASYAASLASATHGTAGDQTSTNGTTTSGGVTTNGGSMGSEGGKKGSNGEHAPAPSTTTNPSTVTVQSFRGFYLRLQVAVHQQAIVDYSTIAVATRNAAVRAYACHSLPVLRRHLETVQRAIGSAQPALAMSGGQALAGKVSAACKSATPSG
jgi:predicted outer membrane protein